MKMHKERPFVTLQYFQSLHQAGEIERFTKIAGGFSSAELFRLDGKNSSFLARISAGIYGIDGFLMEMRVHAHMASVRLAPELIAFEEASLLSIAEYIEDQGCAHLCKTSPHKSIPKIIELARSIHNVNAQPFMRPRNIFLEMATSLKALPSDFLDADVIKHFELLLKTPWPTDRVCLTHFDFHPHNILFDGKKYFAIDWEMAGLGHPFFDIAVLGNFLGSDKRSGYALLEGYLEGPISEQDRTTFDDLRMICYGFWAVVNFHSASFGDMSQKHHSTINADNAFALWSQASREKNPHLHYRLAQFFMAESAKFKKRA